MCIACCSIIQTINLSEPPLVLISLDNRSSTVAHCHVRHKFGQVCWQTFLAVYDHKKTNCLIPVVRWEGHAIITCSNCPSCI